MAVWSNVKKSALTRDFRLDAEYYRPQFIELDQKLVSLETVPWGSLEGRFIVGPFGSDFNTENYVEDSPYRYIRGRDVKPFFLLDDDNAYIPKVHFEALSKYRLVYGDLLISVVGTLGNCALVTAEVGEAVFSCKSTAFRPSNKEADFPYYLVAYLNSHIGSSYLERMPRGAVQTGLNLDDLKAIPIFLPSESAKKRIAGLVRAAEEKRQGSKRLLAEAEAKLVEALGVQKLDMSPKLHYSRKFCELQAARRFGAEYFMPCKQQVLTALTISRSRPLGAYYCSIRDLFDPKNAKRGQQVRNFNLTDAREPILDDHVEPQAAIEIGSTKKILQIGDVVISRLRSYLREIALVRTTPDVRAVGSSEFIVLRPRKDKQNGISPETLLILLRSLPVQIILKWSQDGSQHPRFNEADLLAIPVPDTVERIAPQVDTLVHEAMAARAEAASMLEKAKAEVERLVLSVAE